MVQKMILSEGFDGDRHVMSYEEAKQEIYDIALNDVGKFEEYRKTYPNHTSIDYALFKQDCFEDEIKNGYCFEYHGVIYQNLDDEVIEKLWNELADVPFDENESGELILSEDCFIFDKGTEKEEIWHWFDDNHSKGVGWLMNEFYDDTIERRELSRIMAMSITKKLTEEECINAAIRLYRPYFASVKIQNAFYSINGKKYSIDVDSNLIEMLIKEYFNPIPYKFEDLKPNMFVFDKDFNGWGEILRIIETCVNKYGEKLVKCLATGDSSLQTRSYKENRFFPVTKAG